MDIINRIDWNSIALVLLGVVISQGFYSLQQWRKREDKKRRLKKLLKIELNKGIEKSGSHVPIMITSTLIHDILDPDENINLLRELLHYWVLAEDYRQSVYHLGEGLEEEISAQAKKIIDMLDQ